jgi:hypothetical protein
MRHSVTYDAPADLIRVTAAGRPAPAGFRAVMDACAAVLDEHGCRRLLTDYRGLDNEFDDLTVPMLADLADHAVALAAPRSPVTLAIVCADGTQFALTRVWEVLATRPDLDVQYRVFLDVEEATRWLDATRPPHGADDASG